jgi:hypothetical protein
VLSLWFLMHFDDVGTDVCGDGCWPNQIKKCKRIKNCRRLPRYKHFNVADHLAKSTQKPLQTQIQIFYSLQSKEIFASNKHGKSK